MFRRHDPEDGTPLRRGPTDRTWSTRIAWAVLAVGAGAVLLRCSVATVVQIHGDGMAPTIMDDDRVLLLRGRWAVDRGDIVVYDPTPAPAARPETGEIEVIHPEGDRDTTTFPDARKRAHDPLRNTAVVDAEDIERNWEKVQRRSDGLLTTTVRPRSLRVGRVLAVPGDTVAFNVPDAALGLVINGKALEQKPGDTLRLVLADGEASSIAGDESIPAAQMRATAYESIGERRYPVLVQADRNGEGWPALALPPAEHGPVEIEAPGYLVLADNREEGSCCDSRAIGWVLPDHLKGEVIARVAGNPQASPDLDPAARGPVLLP